MVKLKKSETDRDMEKRINDTLSQGFDSWSIGSDGLEEKKRYTCGGKLHRKNGPAVIHKNGDKFWYHHGKFHRNNGPAVEFINGEKWWYNHGKLHREDGPAVEGSDGSKFWYLDGIGYSEEEWFKEVVKRWNKP